MNKLSVAVAIILLAPCAYAQSRGLKDIDRELKQTKSTAAAVALIKAIGETEPKTEEDIRILGLLMDSYPREGQRALARTKNQNLSKAVMKECDRQVGRFQTDKNKDWRNLPEAQRLEKFNALLNAQAIVTTLGNLKSLEALPYLKQYVTPEYDAILSYTASQAIGKIAPDDPAIFKELWDRPGVKDINYSAYGKSVLKEVAEKMQDPNISAEEQHKVLVKARVSLLSGSSKEEKALIKDILMNHPNYDLRVEAQTAMVHAVMNNPEGTDKDFVIQWAKKEKSMAVWDVTYVMDRIWDTRFIPVLIEMLQNQAKWMPRKNIAELFGRHKIKESLPYLEACVGNDLDGDVRGECRDAVWQMTGRIPQIFHPDDVKDFEEQMVAPYSIEFYSKLKNNDPIKIYHDAIEQALIEYKKTHPNTTRGK